MKPTTHFKSRYQFKEMLKRPISSENGIAMISISDNVREMEEMETLVAGSINDHPTLFLYFSDDESSMCIDEAKQIVDFINKHHSKTMIVHCFAGVSRSGAVAKFINDFFDRGEWWLEDYQGYNRYVYQMLQAASGTSISAYYAAIEKEERTDP